MNYVNSFNMFGTDVKQTPCITGSGAPTTAIEGAVGCLYMDSDTGAIYKCTAVTDGAYSWRKVGEGGSGDSVELDETLTQAGMAADAKAVGDKIGNIETALDEIIELQNELIGGDE